MKMPRLRFSILAMLVLIAVVSIGLAYWQQRLAWEAGQEKFTEIVVDGKNERPTTQQIESIERLIRNYPELAQEDGAILWGARYGSAELVRQMLAGGADPNQASQDGTLSPIHSAVGRGDTEMVAALLDAGANIETKGTHRLTRIDDITPLHVAAIDGNIALCRLLLKHDADLAATYGSQSRGMNALRAGTMSATPPTSRNTILHAAVIGGDLETIQFLLEQNAPRTANSADILPEDVARYLRRGYQDDTEEARTYDKIIRLFEEHPPNSPS